MQLVGRRRRPASILGSLAPESFYNISRYWTLLYLMSSPSPQAGIRGCWVEEAASSSTGERPHLFSFHPWARTANRRLSPSHSSHPWPCCTVLFALCYFTKLCLFDLSIYSLFPSINWETGMRAEEELKASPSEGGRWRSQGTHLTSLCLSSRHFFNRLPHFTVAFLLSTNVLNCMDTSSLYVWGKCLSVLNSLCPCESCDGTLAVHMKPRLIEDRVKPNLIHCYLVVIRCL